MEENTEIPQSSPDESDGTSTKKPKTLFERIESWCSRNKKQLAVMGLLAFALVTSVGIGIAAYSNIDADCNELRSQVSDCNAEVSSLQKSNSDLKSKISSLENEKNALELEHSKCQDQQATIDDEKAKLEGLHTKLDALQNERDSLQAQVNEKKLEEEKAAKQKDERRIEKESRSAGIEQTVYWVSGGKCYHTTQNCPTLKRSSNIHSGSISASGKSRCCKVCG